MPPTKTWKEALLSSGMPLEATVARILTEHDCFVPGEHEFTVVNIDGTRTNRSIDIYGMWALPSASLQLAVECKYRRDGVRWFFIRQSHKVMGQEDWMTNCLVEPFVPPWYADLDYVLPPVVRFGHHPPADQHILPIGVKGVQILPGRDGGGDRSSDETPIKNALYQVRYAGTALQFGFPALPREHFEPWVLSDDFRFVLPVIVTTAKLHVLKQGIGVPEIREACDPEDVSDSVPALIVDKEPGADLRHYCHVLLMQYYDQLLKSPLTMKEALAWKDRMFQRPAANQSSLADLQSWGVPKRVVIVNLDSFSSLVGSWKELFSNEDLLQAYEHGITLDGTVAFDMAKRRLAFAAQRNKSK